MPAARQLPAPQASLTSLLGVLRGALQARRPSAPLPGRQTLRCAAPRRFAVVPWPALLHSG